MGYLTPGDPQFLERQHGLAGLLVAHGLSLPQAQLGALALIDRTVQTQASVMAYNDGYLLLELFFLVVAPAILLLRIPRAAAQEGAGKQQSRPAAQVLEKPKNRGSGNPKNGEARS